MQTLTALNESYDYGIQCMGLEKQSVHYLRPTETRKGTFYFTVSTYLVFRILSRIFFSYFF